MVQQSDFSKTPFRQNALGIDIRNLLNRASFPRAPMASRYDAPISTLPKLFYILVLGINNEG
jgi:hypothetical protein